MEKVVIWESAKRYTLNRPSGQMLVKRLVKGDEPAFKMIYEQYWSRLYQLCFYYTRSREDSEDILIGIFMSLWNNRHNAAIENLESYLVKAAKNQSLKYLLKQQRQRKQALLLKQQAAVLVDENDAPDLSLETKDLSLRIHNQVQALPEKTRKIFVLNREGGLTYEEISGYLGVSVKTVEYHISKALRVLGKYMLVLLLASLLLFK